MPRFATQVEADAAHASAMAGLSSDQLTWEEYGAAHPNESVGAPPLPGNSRSFSERREGHYKSANDFTFPEDPPDSSSSDSVTRSVRPRLGTRSTHSESPEQLTSLVGHRELFNSDSSDDKPPPLVNGDESDDEDRDGEAQEKGRPMTPPSPPPMRRFRFLGRLPPPPDQRGFRYLRQHARPRDIPEPPDPPDDVRVRIGPVRPVSPDNATGGDPVPPPRHGVLDSGATVTVLTGKHRGYIYELDDSLSGSAVATVARGGVLLIDGGGRAGVFDGVLYYETLRNTVVRISSNQTRFPGNL
jgi:hypothetical protein